jgi:hypothetical protein
MYASFHRNLIISVVVVSLLHLLVFVGGVYVIFQLNILPDVLGDLAEPLPRWLLVLSTPEPGFLRSIAMAGIACVLVFAVLANLGVRKLYRRTDSA